VTAARTLRISSGDRLLVDAELDILRKPSKKLDGI